MQSSHNWQLDELAAIIIKASNRWDVDDLTSCVVRRYKNLIQECVAMLWLISDLTGAMYIGNIIHHSTGVCAAGSEGKVNHYYNPLVLSIIRSSRAQHILLVSPTVVHDPLYTVTTNVWLTPLSITTAHMLKALFGVSTHISCLENISHLTRVIVPPPTLVL